MFLVDAGQRLPASPFALHAAFALNSVIDASPLGTDGNVTDVSRLGKTPFANLRGARFAAAKVLNLRGQLGQNYDVLGGLKVPDGLPALKVEHLAVAPHPVQLPEVPFNARP